MIGYYLITAISLIYTSNLEEGFKSLETKLSFLVFPIFLFFIFSDTPKVRKNIVHTFVFSGLAYVLFSLIYAGYNYTNTHSISSFFYGEIGIRFFQEESFVHPTYASFFMNFIIAYLVLLLLNKELNTKNKTIVIFLVLIFSLFIILLSSKFGILALGINIFMLLVYYIKKSGNFLKAIGVFSLAIIFSYVLIINTPLKVRFETSYNELINPTEKTSSTKTRKDVWRYTTEIIQENPILGVGTGDIRDVLAEKYLQDNQQVYWNRNYDSHQQFLQTYASAGILGLLSLLLIFILLIRKSILNKNYLLLVFSVLFFLFGMIESMLERQAGIIFFTFFGLLLFTFNPNKK